MNALLDEILAEIKTMATADLKKRYYRYVNFGIICKEQSIDHVETLRRIDTVKEACEVELRRRIK